MTDNMVERVAMAIRTAVVKINGGKPPDNLDIETEPFDPRELEVARGVLTAMRVAPYEICRKAGAGLTPGMASAFWANMIDASLSQPTT